ncbi:MAG TPA: histidine phosphatase family protein [Bacteroidota bacterium]
MHSDTVSLVLVRHGEAASVGGTVPNDAERPLTARGAEDAKAIGRLLARLDHSPGLILTSSLRRAIQTGELIGTELGTAARRGISRNLDPGFRNTDLFEEVFALRQAGEQNVAMVGHQPDLGNFIAFLIAGSAPTSVALAPGTAARLSVRTTGGRPEAVLHWLMPATAAHALLLAPSRP